MFVRRSVTILFSNVAMLTALLVTPASAESAWTPPDRLDLNNFGGTAATTGTGDTVAVWESDSGVKLSYRRNAGPWTVPRNAPADHASVAVAMDQRRNTVLAWAAEGECFRYGEHVDGSYFESSEHDFRVHVAYGGPKGRWEREALKVGWDGCTPRYPSAVVDDDGVVTVGWVGYRDRPFVSQRLVDGTWTFSRPLSETPVNQIEAAVDADGKAVIVWAEDDKAWSSTSLAPRRWSEPEAVVSTGGYIRSVLLDADPVGNLGLGYLIRPGKHQTSPERFGFRLRRAGADRWRAGETTAIGPVEQAENLRDVGKPALALAVHGGRATVAWLQETGSDDHAVVMSSTRRPGQGWATPSARSGPIPSSMGDSYIGWEAPDLAISERGAALAWRRPEGDSLHFERAVMRRDGGWSAPEIAATRSGLGPMYNAWRGLHNVLAPQTGLFSHLFLADDGLRVSDNISDRTAPTVRMLRPRRHVVLGDPVPVAWVATDELTGVAGVDVRVRSAGRKARFSPWRRWLDATTARSSSLAVKPGRTYCVSARATDRAGNTGRWSRQRCAVAPLDDRALRAGTAWRRVTNKPAYQRTLTTTSRRGARLVMPGVRAKRLSLVAGTCPTCGTVEVRHAGRLVGTVDLSSPRPRQKRVFTLQRYRHAQRGKVVVRVTSAGKPVRIDGVAASAG